MARMVTSAAALPLYTLDLARRYWAPLLCAYAVGTFLHTMLLRQIVRLGLTNQLLGMAALSLSLLVTLTTTIIMFHMLRPGLPVLERELSASADGSPNSMRMRERRVVDAIAMAILPFLIFYSAWGLITEEFRVYAVSAFNEGGVEALEYVGDLDYSTALIGIAVGLLVARVVVEHFYRKSNNPLLGVVTAILEAGWVFFAIYTVQAVLRDVTAWTSSRAVWIETRQVGADFLTWLGDLVSLPLLNFFTVAFGFLATGWGLVKDGLFEPLLWLTIAAVAFGAKHIDSAEALFQGRARRVHEAAVTLRGRFPRLIDLMTHGARQNLNDKYWPFLNAFRLILSVSPVFYLSFCLYYMLLELGFGWLERAVYVVVGANDFHGWWWQWLNSVSFAVDGLHELLRICLLAAAFELTLRRLGRRTSGRRARANVVDEAG
ncbi:hypothetical protein J4H86_16070 [Spiractinospora alimapuensis]|uniref:hypothetical protein n=1 Tax=Spiractinospora alimapuensis TaxID=2820884 RepID=UPI001F1876C4|nr:hypothetical protein [Spiractinospora alimapuensis]QVQ50438.1 hypothetical protein J4H86_16070 [Spiractinospora alimapuensis]